MKSILLIAILGLSQVASAKAPQISCDVLYMKKTKEGYIDLKTPSARKVLDITEDFRALGLVLNGFAVEAVITEMCASDGVTCSGIYDLSLQVTKGDSTSSMRVEIGEYPDRYSTSLQVGLDEVYLNCDVL